MTKLKGILLTEGMHGMISQVEGLANALILILLTEKLNLKVFGNLFHQVLLQSQIFLLKNLKYLTLI